MDGFVDYEALKWSRNLKRHLRDLDEFKFHKKHLRRILVRPFSERSCYFADLAVDEPGHMAVFFPNEEAEEENRMIAVTDVSFRAGWSALATNRMTDLHLCASTDAFQCFPFYTYDGEEGSRRENIPLSTLVRFQNHYGDEAITKWDIFHYVYAVLHHPEYRTRYAANLRRELPRIPLVGAPTGAVGTAQPSGASAAAGEREERRERTALRPVPLRVAVAPFTNTRVATNSPTCTSTEQAANIAPAHREPGREAELARGKDAADQGQDRAGL